MTEMICEKCQCVACQTSLSYAESVGTLFEHLQQFTHMHAVHNTSPKAPGAVGDSVNTSTICCWCCCMMMMAVSRTSLLTATPHRPGNQAPDAMVTGPGLLTVRRLVQDTAIIITAEPNISYSCIPVFGRDLNTVSH